MSEPGDWSPESVSPRQRRALKARAHSLRPLVSVGKDELTEGVIAAVDAALVTHELVKVKLLKACSLDKTEAATRLAEETGAALIQRIGRTTVLFRPRPEEGPDETPGA